MAKITILLVLLFNYSQLFCQFESCNSNTIKTLNDVYFIDESIGIAVGDSGIITRSIDGGLNWATVLNLDTIHFKKVKFWNNLNGIAIGTSIYLSNDGGQNWAKKETQSNYFADIELISNDKAVITGSGSKILGVSNFGQEIIVINNPNLLINLTHLSFIDESIGYATMQDGAISKLFKSIDGGQSWAELENKSGDQTTITEDLYFVTEDIGFKGGWYNPQLVKSTDGGLNWQQSTLEGNDWPFWSSIYDFHIDRDSQNIYYSCGWYGEIFKSFDQGDSWKKLDSPVNSTTALRSIFFLNENLGWAVGESGTIIRTTTGGLTSSKIHKPSNQIKIYPNPFVNEIGIDGIDVLNIMEVNIFNQKGQLIVNKPPAVKFDLNKLLKGIYFIEIKTTSNNYFQKIVKF